MPQGGGSGARLHRRPKIGIFSVQDTVTTIKHECMPCYRQVECNVSFL